jgi:hypothetical protein
MGNKKKKGNQSNQQTNPSNLSKTTKETLTVPSSKIIGISETVVNESLPIGESLEEMKQEIGKTLNTGVVKEIKKPKLREKGTMIAELKAEV